MCLNGKEVKMNVFLYLILAPIVIIGFNVLIEKISEMSFWRSLLIKIFRWLFFIPIIFLYLIVVSEIAFQLVDVTRSFAWWLLILIIIFGGLSFFGNLFENMSPKVVLEICPKKIIGIYSFRILLILNTLVSLYSIWFNTKIAFDYEVSIFRLIIATILQIIAAVVLFIFTFIVSDSDD